MIKYINPGVLSFPPVEEADRSGILAIGGDLSAERLMLAYKGGIFPWFDETEPIIWWSPPERMVLFFDELVVSKSMRSVLKKNIFRVTFNTSFREVISNCRKITRYGENRTWITSEMHEAYCQLHELGIAKSVEVWRDNELVGGLYGVDLGHIFCGESMFSKFSNASKVGFIMLARKLQAEKYKLIDCQVYTEHLESLGAKLIPRAEFLEILRLKT
ncbi:MAG TPA: leucyl/phenylalanyl-tRNA--protein transferase [Flavobacterium sp.]|jgi:leucyl/phenylalanyl-tRNA--protein transferase